MIRLAAPFLVPALCAVLALPAAAQQEAPSQATDQAQADAPAAGEGRPPEPPEPPHLTASMIQDARIVSLEGSYDETVWDGGDPLQPMVAGLTEIGGVDEIVISESGEVLGVTTDVGGFLGIGQKSVMIPLDDLRLARDPDKPEDVTVITRLDSEALQNAPAFEED